MTDVSNYKRRYANYANGQRGPKQKGKVYDSPTKTTFVRCCCDVHRMFLFGAVAVQ